MMISGFTYEVDTRVNALRVKIECKSDEINVASSFSVAE
jgi:hypothetical protein